MTARLHRRWSALIGAGLFALVGCTDATNVAQPDTGVMADAEVPDLEPVADAEVPPIAPDMAPPAPMPAWVQVDLDPRRSLYALDATAQVEVVVFDRDGAPMDLDALELTYEVAPNAVGQIDADGVLTFSGEGPATVLVCAGPVCGRAGVHVDDGPPTLNVEAPEREAIIGGQGGDTLIVTGTATDTAGPVEVRVNGVRAEIDDAGAFSAEVPARFGINRIEVTADDGVQRDVAYDVRDVLWAPRFGEVDPTGVSVPGAATVRLDQTLLDTDNPIGIGPDADVLRIGDFAQLLDALVQLIDLGAVLPDPQIAEGEPLDLRLTHLSLGRPEIDMIFTPAGIELFMVLAEIEVDTEGELVLEGEGISLDGTLVAEVSAFMQIDIGLDEQLSVEVGGVLVNLEGVRGRYASETANALVGTLGTLLGNIVRDLAAGLIDGLVQEQLPGIIDGALDAVVGTISSIPLAFDTGIEGVPPIDLELQLNPAALDIRAGEMLQLNFDARIQHPAEIVAPAPDPGVPTISDPVWIEAPGDGIGATSRLMLLNALLHEVWRVGLLQITPPLPGDLSGVLGDVTLDGRMPPVVVQAPVGAELPLEVQVGGLRMATIGPGAEAADVYSISLKVGAGVEVEGARLSLVLAETPDIEVVLVEQVQEFPLLNEALLEGLLLRVVWPMVQDALGEGLSFGVDPIAVDPAALAAYAPRLESMTLAPRFRQAPRIEQGRLTLEGLLDVQVEIGAAGDAPPDEPPPDEPPPDEPPPDEPPPEEPPMP